MEIFFSGRIDLMFEITVKSDSAFKATCRRQQSHHRETVLKENYEIDSTTDINET